MKKGNTNRKGKFDFLVIGAGRGGTSLLAGLLDAHSKLELGFEKYSYDFLMAQNMAGNNDTLKNRISLFLEKSSNLAEKSNKIWGNKITSEQVCALEETKEEDWLERFVGEAVGQKKIIYILRDGRTCVHSKMKRTGQTFVLALQRWKASITLWRELQALLPEIHTLKFEDLVRDPEAELKAICQFLEVDYESKMLKGTSNTKMRKEYQKEHFDTSPLHIPEEMSLRQREMLPELQLAGYE